MAVDGPPGGGWEKRSVAPEVRKQWIPNLSLFARELFKKYSVLISEGSGTNVDSNFDQDLATRGQGAKARGPMCHQI